MLVYIIPNYARDLFCKNFFHDLVNLLGAFAEPNGHSWV